MVRKVSLQQKNEIHDNFLNGYSLKALSVKYNFSVQTITRQLKSILEEKEFKKLKIKNNSLEITEKELESKKKNKEFKNIKKDFRNNEKNLDNSKKSLISQNQNFFYEIPPLDNETSFEEQKDVSTQPLSEIKFPEVVYLLVDKNIELEPKLLKEYPEWSFLPEDDQNRKTLKIYSEHKDAKLSCKKNEKLIKVPNPKVFFIVSNILKNKGISRIIFKDLIFSL